MRSFDPIRNTVRTQIQKHVQFLVYYDNLIWLLKEFKIIDAKFSMWMVKFNFSETATKI